MSFEKGNSGTLWYGSDYGFRVYGPEPCDDYDDPCNDNDIEWQAGHFASLDVTKWKVSGLPRPPHVVPLPASLPLLGGALLGLAALRRVRRLRGA